MKLLRTALVITALGALAGCVAVPVEQPYYASGPAYYPAPVYYGPAVGVGVYGHWHGGWHGGGHRHG